MLPASHGEFLRERPPYCEGRGRRRRTLRAGGRPGGMGRHRARLGRRRLPAGAVEQRCADAFRV